MAFQQVRDFLRHIQSLRNRVLDVVRRRQADAPDEIFAALLDRARIHDRFMEQCLSGRLEKAPEGVLDTWIQFNDMEPLECEVAALSEEEERGTDAEIVQQILALDQRLLRLYELAAEQARSPRVQKFFEDLLQMEEQKARAKSRDCTEISDLRDA